MEYHVSTHFPLWRSKYFCVQLFYHYLFHLHRICMSLAQNDMFFVLGGKCNVDIASYNPSFYPWMKINSKNYKQKKCCPNIILFFKRICIFNSTSTSIHLSKTWIIIKRAENVEGLLNRVFCKRNMHFPLQDLLCVRIIIKLWFFLFMLQREKKILVIV